MSLDATRLHERAVLETQCTTSLFGAIGAGPLGGTALRNPYADQEN